MKKSSLIPFEDTTLFQYRNKTFIFRIKQNLLQFLIKEQNEITPSELDAIDIVLLSIDELVTHYLDRELVRNNKIHVGNSQLLLLKEKLVNLESKLKQIQDLNNSIIEEENIPSYLIVREKTRMLREIHFYEEEIRKTKEEIYLLNANLTLKTGTLQSNGSYREDPSITNSLIKQVHDLLKGVSKRPLSIKIIEQTLNETVTLNSLFGDD